MLRAQPDTLLHLDQRIVQQLVYGQHLGDDQQGIDVLDFGETLASAVGQQVLGVPVAAGQRALPEQDLVPE